MDAGLDGRACAEAVAWNFLAEFRNKEHSETLFCWLSCRPRARSVLHCHGVWALREGPLTGAVQDKSQLHEDASKLEAGSAGRQANGRSEASFYAVQKATCSNTMAVKNRSSPRPAAQTAKHCCLSCVETSSRHSICLPSCTASFQLAYLFLFLQLACLLAVLHRWLPQSKLHSAFLPAAFSSFFNAFLSLFAYFGLLLWRAPPSSLGSAD